MNTDLIEIIAGLVLITSVLLFFISRIGHHSHDPKNPNDIISEKTDTAVREIFNDQFREELKNRGRLHFEKIIGENAMFLQQDLRLTTSQVNEFMKQQITTKLQEEFKTYTQSIMDARNLAMDSITKTQQVIDEQRKVMSKQISEELARDKSQILAHFEEHMAEIVNHYLLAAVGKQIDLTDQLDYILSELEGQKQNIIEDIKHGA